MKTKSLCLSFLLVWVGGLMTQLLAQETFDEGDYTFTVTSEAEKTVSLGSRSGVVYAGAITLPASVSHGGKTYAVTALQDWALAQDWGDPTGHGNVYDLTSVTVPEGYVSLGEFSLRLLPNLVELKLPASLREVGDNALQRNHKLEGFTLASGNQYLASVDGVLYSKDRTRLVAYPAGRLMEEFVIPNTVTSIAISALCALDIPKIVIGTGLTAIPSWCFTDCTFESIIIPGNVKEIGDNAFKNCYKLRSVTLQEGIESLHYDLFAGTPLESISVPATVTGIDRAFSNATSLKHIEVAEGNTVFKSVDDVLYTKDGLFLSQYPCAKEGESYEVPLGTRKIGATSFLSAQHLKHVSLPDGLKDMDWLAFNNTQIDTLVVPSTVNWIANIFNGGPGHIYFTSTVAPWMEIGEGDFLTPEIVVHVPYGSKASYEAACPRLSAQLNDEWLPVGSTFTVGDFTYRVHDSSWYNDANGNATLQIAPNGNILSDADRDCIYFDQPLIKNVSQLSSPFTEPTEGALKDLLDSNPGSFWHSQWSGASAPLGSHYLVAEIEGGLTDGVVLRMARRRWAESDHPTKFKVYGATAEGYNPAEDTGNAGTWTELGDIAMPFGSDNEIVTSQLLTFEGSYRYLKLVCTEKIGPDADKAFWHASELQLYKGVRVPAGGVVLRPSVTYMGNTYQVTRVQECAFKDSELTSIVIPEGIRRLDYESIYHCPNLTELHLPASLDDMDPYAITWNANLKTITVAEGGWAFKTVDDVLFSKDGKRLYVYPGGKEGDRYEVPFGTEVLNGDAFAANEHLREIVIPETVEALNDYILSGSKVTSLILPLSLNSLTRKALDNAGSLTSVVFQTYTPPTWEADVVINGIAKFYVPKGRRQAYINAWAATGIDPSRIVEGVMEPGSSFAVEGIKYIVLDNANDVWAVNAADNSNITDASQVPSTVTYANWEFTVHSYATAEKENVYLLNKNRSQYLMRGAAWNAHAALNPHGAEFTLIHLYDNQYAILSHIQFEGEKSKVYAYLDKENGLYLDGPMREFTREKTTSGDAFYTLMGDDLHKAYITAEAEGNGVNVIAMDAPIEASLWILQTKAERLTQLSQGADGTPRDATFLISDPDFGTGDLRFWDWKTENQVGTTLENMRTDYNHNGYMNTAATSFDFYQTLNGIPNGTYRIGVQGCYRETGSMTDLPYFYANGVKCNVKNIMDEASDHRSDTFNEEVGGKFVPVDHFTVSRAITEGYYRHEFIVTVTDGTLRLGVKNTSTSCNVVWDNFEMDYLGAYTAATMAQTVDGVSTETLLYTDRDYVLEDGAESISVTGGDQQVRTLTYHRNFSNTEWQSLYVPFSMNYEDWCEDYDIARLNNINQYDTDLDGVADLTVLEIFPVQSGSIKPNYPYLIRAKEAGEKHIVLPGATLCHTASTTIDCSSITTLYSFTGIYQKMAGTVMYDNGYFALGGGSLRQTSSAQNGLGAYRWYMNVTDREGAQKATSEVHIFVYGEDDATGLKLIESTGDMAPCYDLTGRKIAQPARGLYIKNGKKFINR